MVYADKNRLLAKSIIGFKITDTGDQIKPQGTSELGFTAKEINDSGTGYFTYRARLYAESTAQFLEGHYSSGDYAGIFTPFEDACGN